MFGAGIQQKNCHSNFAGLATIDKPAGSAVVVDIVAAVVVNTVVAAAVDIVVVADNVKDCFGNIAAVEVHCEKG